MGPRRQASLPTCVLVVDDDEDAVFVLKAYLEKNGEFRVLQAFDGHCALHLAEVERPDIILLDVMMPDLDGLATCAMLRDNSETSSIPVIMLTARNDVETVVESFRRGAVNYITKPIDPARLVAKIREAMHGRGETREAGERGSGPEAPSGISGEPPQGAGECGSGAPAFKNPASPPDAPPEPRSTEGPRSAQESPEGPSEPPQPKLEG